MHKFDFNWTLKDAQFTKDKGKVFSCFACGGGRQWDINLPDLTLSDAMR
jgi:DNA (cytosine-5)-methyltransferase 1